MNTQERIDVCNSHIRRHSVYAVFSALISMAAVTIMVLLWIRYAEQTNKKALDQNKLDHSEELAETQQQISQILNSLENLEVADMVYSTNRQLFNDELKKNESKEDPEITMAETIRKYYDIIMEHGKIEVNELTSKLKKIYDKLNDLQKAIDSPESMTPLISEERIYAFNALFFIVFIFAFLGYRFHAKEIARNEQYKIGFLRIQMATDHSEHPGSEGQIQKSLVEFAFGYPPRAASFSKERKKSEKNDTEPSSEGRKKSENTGGKASLLVNIEASGDLGNKVRSENEQGDAGKKSPRNTGDQKKS